MEADGYEKVKETNTETDVITVAEPVLSGFGGENDELLKC